MQQVVGEGAHRAGLLFGNHVWIALVSVLFKLGSHHGLNCRPLALRPPTRLASRRQSRYSCREVRSMNSVYGAVRGVRTSDHTVIYAHPHTVVKYMYPDARTVHTQKYHIISRPSKSVPLVHKLPKSVLYSDLDRSKAKPSALLRSKVVYVRAGTTMSRGEIFSRSSCISWKRSPCRGIRIFTDLDGNQAGPVDLIVLKDQRRRGDRRRQSGLAPRAERWLAGHQRPTNLRLSLSKPAPAAATRLRFRHHFLHRNHVRVA